jgi:hypothetical protein
MVERRVRVVNEAFADHLEFDEHLALAKELAQRPHVLLATHSHDREISA